MKRNVLAENMHPGSAEWETGERTGTRDVDDIGRQIKGYASAASVNAGDHIDFHVSVMDGGAFTVQVYRFGYYGGVGARHLLTSPRLQGSMQPSPVIDETTGMISCNWQNSWTLNVPRNWASGAYLAVFTTADGWRSYAPFVVRKDSQKANFCVIVPFSTYQAYNMWPMDGKTGKSFYFGYEPAATELFLDDVDAGGIIESPGLNPNLRATEVSFDRPFAATGLPNQFTYDLAFIRWAERMGYDMTYATSIELHNGAIDLMSFKGLIFGGHDEYWTQSMRKNAERAVARGVSLAFMTANNSYWHVRLEDAPDGRPNRTIACYKSTADPGPGPATVKWREKTLGPWNPEQLLLGVQYRAVVPAPVPLCVSSADHWVWAGTGVRDGDLIEKIVGGEADDVDPRYRTPAGMRQTILARSPYVMRNGRPQVHNTSISETESKVLVFVAGTFFWTLGLEAVGFVDRRIQQATANVLNRILATSRLEHSALRARHFMLRVWRGLGWRARKLRSRLKQAVSQR